MERRQFLKAAATGAAGLASAYAAPAWVQASPQSREATGTATTRGWSQQPSPREPMATAPPSGDPALWQARWEGLRHAIMVTRDSLSDDQALFRALLVNLEGFAAQQVGFLPA